MSRRIGPETVKGESLSEVGYTELWQALAGQPRGVLMRLCNRLNVHWEEKERQKAPGGGFRIIADVTFGERYRGWESVHGPTIEVVLAKALALGIDRRLGAIVSARRDIDVVTDVVPDNALMYRLEKVILQASVPTSSPAAKPDEPGTNSRKGE